VSDSEAILVKKIQYIMESKTNLPEIYHLVVDSQRQNYEHFMRLLISILNTFKPSEFGNLDSLQSAFIKQTYNLDQPKPKSDSTRSLSTAKCNEEKLLVPSQQSKNGTIVSEIRHVISKLLSHDINELELRCANCNNCNCVFHLMTY
jgi:predicted Zn-ribbon and HTH transcriptional regulator